MLHKIAHLLGWNYGTVHTETRNGRCFVGFKCTDCGIISYMEDCEDVIDEQLKQK